jgi:subtilisin family serine protease
MPIRVLNADGLGTERQVADGIRYAVDRGAHVINLSLGTTREARLVREAVTYAQQRNVVVVASIGSHSREEITAPARFPNVLGVAATDNNDRKTGFSNYHASVAVSAPGMRLYSTYWDGGWAWGSGTSFSTALVAGAAALVRGMHPTWDATSVQDTIRNTSAPIDALNPGFQFRLGAGRIDLYRAVTDR